MQEPGAQKEDFPSPTVIYLISHGLYSKPRLIDIQYQRIMRFHSLVNETSRYRNIRYTDLLHPPDIDMGVNIYNKLTQHDVPAFMHMLRRYEQGEYKSVILDINTNVATNSSTGESIILTLKERKIPHINVFYEDRFLMEKLDMHENLGWLLNDNGDFITFFPKLAADIINHADSIMFEGHQSRQWGSLTAQHISNALRDENPYMRGQIPTLSTWAQIHMKRQQEKHERERRMYASPFIIQPGTKGLLINEGLTGEPRQLHDLLRVVERLQERDFTAKTINGALCLTMKAKIGTLYHNILADPRQKDSLTFYIYPTGTKKSDPQCKVTLPEQWENLKSKILKEAKKNAVWE